MPGGRAPLPRHMVEEVMLGNDVENGCAYDLAGMIETHAVQHAGPAVVAGGIEARIAQRSHHLDLILRHGAKGITAVILAARRLLRIAVSTQVGRNHRELLRQARRDLVPGKMGERISVHEQERRSVPAAHGDDARAARPYLGTGEAFEHGDSEWRVANSK